MKKLFTISTYLIVGLFIFVSCKNKAEIKDDTITTGEATFYVDETIFPIIEEQRAVFENQYPAKINLVSKSETEVINSLANDTTRVVILARNLNNEELNLFKSKKIEPKITKFATDAVAFVSNKRTLDTLITIQNVIDFIHGKEVAKIKGLVFDNPNSSTVRYMLDLAGVNAIPEKNVFSFSTNDQVLKYVSENNGMIGVVGLNWLYDPKIEMKEIIHNINVLSVKGQDVNEYVFPSQDNLAAGKYPLARDLYIVNCQGYSGLGMGFASFLGGERGQRIVLKSGLVPVRYPSRKIRIKS